MDFKMSSRMEQVKASEIREILKLSVKPEIISFAGGLPAPELFPVEEMKIVSQKVLDTMGRTALQYSPTEGYDPLREHIARRMGSVGIKTKGENILITTGSQQGLDLSGKLFLNKSDYVVCERPSYLGAISAFKAYECEFLEIETDDDGMIMDDLRKKLASNDNVKMIYVIPDFQNPSGRTWKLNRRKELLEIAGEFNLPIIEDNPYGELRFDGEYIASLKELDQDGRVIFLGTFSKTFCPGLRVGWVCAKEEVLDKYILLKQGADLHSNSLSQRELSVFLDNYDLDVHVEKIRNVYRKRRDIMMQTIKEEFPKEIKYTMPEGGLFTWVELPEYIDTKELLSEALKVNVAFVPGASFFPNGGNNSSMRLNYSNMDEERIVEGIKRLAQVIRTHMK